MRHPQRNTWKICVHVAARGDLPWMLKIKGDAASASRESFDGSSTATVAREIVIEYAHPSYAALDQPQSDDGLDVRQLWEIVLFQVSVYTQDGSEGHKLVKVQKRFVECVSNGGWGVEQKKDHGASSQQAVQVERA